MPRLLQFESHHPRDSARLEWAVPEGSGPLDPAELVRRLGRLASGLVQRAAGAELISVDLERLQLLGEVHAGERLVATAALSRPTSGRWPVSVLVRKAHGRRQPVAAVGVLRFTRAGATLQPVERPEQAAGRARVATSFHVRSSTPDVLVSGNILAWVHASALLCAQGQSASELKPLGLDGVSLYASVEPNERLELECTVLEDTASTVSVLSELKSAARLVTVGRAISRFRRVVRPASQGSSALIS